MYKSGLLFRCVAAMASLAILSAAARAEQKTAKACESEWRANKAALRGSGKTKQAFIVECRSGTGSAAQAPANSEAASEARRSAKRTRPGTTISTGAAEFASEMEAKAHCPGQIVVWANARSKIYHFPGSRAYGNTKNGAYMCEKDTASAGFRSAKNERRAQ